MTDWAEACMTPLPTDNEYVTEWRKAFSEHWSFIRLSISKSNLLWRLMYGGEEIRTRPCPIHKGKWSGCNLAEDTACKGLCMSGHNVTGWLPNESKGDKK
jgi:hypothetical protein